MAAASFALMNERTHCAVADAVEVAVTRNARRKGLLGRTGLAPFSALVLAPCAAVHTMFMRFAIDVIFVDKDGRAVRVVPQLTPWRAAMARVAHAVIELPAGTLAHREVAVGDSLYLLAGGGTRVALRAAELRRGTAMSRAILPADRAVPLAGPVTQILPTDAGGNHYAVLLLNEQQMTQLLQRQEMRPANHPVAPVTVAFDAYTRLMRRARIGMASLAILIAAGSAWMWAPIPVLAFPWTRPHVAPTVATGASFSLAVATKGTADAAADMARRLTANGTPAFTRAVPKKPLHQVMVGPYVSLDEVEAEQRLLANAGFGGTRVFVDDSLRKVPGKNEAAVTPSNPALVLVGAGNHVSLAIELPGVPRQVTTKRSADGSLMVEMGPVDAEVQAQEWSAPDDVDLLRQVKIEQIELTSVARHARATLTMPRSTSATTRVEGNRVYVDLSPAKAIAPAAAAAPAAARRAVASPRPAAVAVAGNLAPVGATPAIDSPKPNAGELLRPVAGRFERLVPFIQSASGTGTADVLRALASNVDEIDAALRQIGSAAETADAHGALTSAVASARRAVDPGFTGDRAAEARQAAMLVEAAKSVMPVTPAR